MTHKWSVTPTEKRNVTISCNLFLLNRYNSRNEWGRWGEKKHGVFSFRDGYFCCVPLKFWGAVTNTRTHRSSSFSLFFLLGPHLSLHPWAALFFRSSSSLFFFTYIFFFFFCRFTLHLILSPLFVPVCVCVHTHTAPTHLQTHTLPAPQKDPAKNKTEQKQEAYKINLTLLFALIIQK